MEKTYKIVRFYRDENKRSRTILKGLTLEQAQWHCRDKSTHKIAKANTKNHNKGDVIWFDGYTEE